MNKSLLSFMKSEFVVFIVILSFFWLNITPVYACTPTPEGKEPPTTADWVRSADLVLTGTVTMVTEVENSNGQEQSATVQVSLYFKGDEGSGRPSQIEIEGFGSSSVCRRFVTVGDTFVFYVQERTDGSLWLTSGDAMASPTTQLITEVTTAMGGSPDRDITNSPPTVSITPPASINVDTPSPETTVSPVKTTSGPILIGTGVLLLLTLITVVLWYRRQT